MFGSSVIEIAIGLTFVFLLLSLICSAIVEIIESFLKNRATDLERGIRELFNQEGGGRLAVQFYNHPMINSLYTGVYKRKDSKRIRFWHYLWPTNLPSYIPARNFANAVLDIVLHPPAEADVVRDDEDTAPDKNAAAPLDAPALPASMQAIRAAVRRNFGSTQVGRALRTLTEQCGDDVDLLRANIETWFNGTMDRVSGHYKRRTQWVLFVLGFFLAVVLNASTIEIAQKLSTDATARSVIVAQAGVVASNPDALKANLESNWKTLASLGLPIGRSGGIPLINPFAQDSNWWSHFLFVSLLGWLFTAGAISLGAPFWFDLLNKFMVIRSTVKPHEKSLEEGSEDRQATPTQPLAGGTRLAHAGSASAGGSPAGGNGLVFPGFTPEPQFNAGPDAPDNESDLDEGDLPIETETRDDNLPAAEGGIG